MDYICYWRCSVVKRTTFRNLIKCSGNNFNSVDNFSYDYNINTLFPITDHRGTQMNISVDVIVLEV